jgi:hypothetical protein
MTTSPDGRTRSAKIGDAVYDALYKRADGSSLIPVARAEVVQDIEALIAAGEISPTLPQRAGNILLKAIGVKNYEYRPDPNAVAETALSRLVRLQRIDMDKTEEVANEGAAADDPTYRLHEGEMSYGEWRILST